MKPQLKREMAVKNQSRLYEHRYPGAESVPAWSVGHILDFKGYRWSGSTIEMLARVRFEVDYNDPDGKKKTRSVDVWVNERALLPIKFA
jgi:hypothetical protein